MKTTPSKIRIAVFDDNPFFLETIGDVVKSDKGFSLCGTFAHANNIISDIKSSVPDIVLMDIDMPGMNGIDALKILRKHFPELPVIMLTQYDDDDKIIASICSGANGYKLKTASPEKIIKSIYDAYNGHTPLSPPIAKKILHLFTGKFSQIPEAREYFLSPRETQVLTLLVEGKSYKMIADELRISYDTVRAHIKHIYKKLQVSSVSGAVSRALREGIIN